MIAKTEYREMIKIKLKTENSFVPSYETSGAAGMDIRAFLSESITIPPGKRALVPTGLYIELPPGYEAQIRARSGLALKHGISLVNGIGTIDSDYRGEIGILLINLGEYPFEIKNGDRIAQMVVSRYETVQWDIAENLTETSRGEGGFGHTGKQ